MKQESSPKPTQLTPRRTINRLALALLALAIALFAQNAFKQENIWDGLILYTLAAPLFVWAVNQNRKSKIVNPKSYFRGLFAPLDLTASKSWQLAGVWILFFALLSSFISWRLFGQEQIGSSAWQFYGGSVVLFIAGILLLTKRPKTITSYELRVTNDELRMTKDKGRRTNYQLSGYTIALLVILLLALILRLWRFGDIPFGVWYDEAEAGLQARRWLSEANFRPAFYDPINISGQFLLLYSAALRFISDTVYGLRFVSVLFGVGSVLAAYLFGKQIRGPVFGLIMAFFMAVMRWDVNFSRIAMTGVDAPFFELLSLYFLARLLRFGRLRDAAFAGLSLGFGLSFYTAFRLFVLALGIFTLLAIFVWPLWRRRRTSPRWWGNQGLRAGVLALAVWIALMPVLQYALDNPDSFSSRVETTSIITKRDDPNLGRALRNSAGKHLAMFNIAGDKNGRHNLPGEPMLDPAMGILMIFGIALAGWGIRQPANLFFLILFPVALIGGVFSLDFEAPQSLRSIAALPAAAYFCALPVMALYHEAKWSLRPLPKQWLLFPAGLAGLVILWLNAHTYFVRQANDFAVWNAFSTPETLAGKMMADLGPGYDFYLSPFLMNHPSIRFISPQTPHHISLNLPNALPIRSDAARPAAIFTHIDDSWVQQEAARLYPAAQFESVSLVEGGPPSLNVAILSPADIASVQGLALRYWAGAEIRPAQIPVKALKVDTVNVDWSAALPLDPPFIAEWEGILYAEQFGDYNLRLNAPDATLEIDGVEVFSGTGEREIRWQLARGNHHFRLRVNSATGREKVSLNWQPPAKTESLIPAAAFYQDPVTINGLLGKYYSNPNWNGAPTLMSIDPFLDTYFHLIPLPRPYSVAWTGFLEAPQTGIYGLGLRAVSDAQLYIDGRLTLDTQIPNETMPGAVSLEAGLHEISVKFLDDQDRSRIHLLWTPPGAEREEPIPSRYLWPPLGDAWQPAAQVAPPNAEFEARPMHLTYVATLNEGLVEPRDVAVGPAGEVYVADTGAKGVQVFSDSELVASWLETPDGPYEEPLALAAGGDGRVYVLDSTRQWVYVFDSAGEPVNKLGGPEAQMYHPRGMALFEAPEGGATLAIANTGSGQILLYSTAGAALGSVGTLGDAPGQLNEPVDILRDQFGAYFITEGANVNRWQRVDPFGKALGSWPNDAPAAFDGSHLTWAPDSSILMTNSAAGALRRYSPDGLLLDEWLSIGPVSFNRPVGIHFDEARSLLYVTDIGAGEVYVFGVKVLGSE